MRQSAHKSILHADTYVNPSNNTIHQTKEQINPANIHVPSDGHPTLFHETAASNKDVAQVFNNKIDRSTHYGTHYLTRSSTLTND